VNKGPKPLSRNQSSNEALSPCSDNYLLVVKEDADQNRTLLDHLYELMAQNTHQIGQINEKIDYLINRVRSPEANGTEEEGGLETKPLMPGVAEYDRVFYVSDQPFKRENQSDSYRATFLEESSFVLGAKASIKKEILSFPNVRRVVQQPVPPKIDHVSLFFTRLPQGDDYQMTVAWFAHGTNPQGGKVYCRFFYAVKDAQHKASLGMTNEDFEKALAQNACGSFVRGYLIDREFLPFDYKGHFICQENAVSLFFKSLQNNDYELITLWFNTSTQGSGKTFHKAHYNVRPLARNLALQP
jgi:hypothetical protein